MKALLCVASDRIADLTSYYLHPLGFDVIRYKNPLKAMDNVDEVDPHAIIMSAEDFPRHWKPFVQLVRGSRPKETCVFILLKGNHFPFEEAAKAVFLGINGVIKENLSDPAELTRFQQILKRYLAVDDQRTGERFVPSIYDRLDFTFSHPERLYVITGKIDSISSSAISFKPDMYDLCADLHAGDALPDCCIRIGEKLKTFSAKVLRPGRIIAIELSGADESIKAALSSYLSSYADRVPETVDS
jgi:hypothetical protein